MHDLLTLGITFSFKYPSVEDFMKMHIISDTSSSQSPSRVHSAAPSPVALMDTEDSGRESEVFHHVDVFSRASVIPILRWTVWALICHILLITTTKLWRHLRPAPSQHNGLRHPPAESRSNALAVDARGILLFNRF